jgi:hypothetical protein
MLLLAFQNTYSDDSFDVLLSKDWVGGQDKSYNGVTINRLYGDNNAASVTNISYQTNEMAVADRIAYGEKNGESATEIAKGIKFYKNHCPGGTMNVLVRRAGMDWADTKYFSIEIRDTTDKNVLFTYQLKEKMAEYEKTQPELAPFGNITVAFITSALPKAFYVYVIDSYDITNRYKFFVRVTTGDQR